jgi:hypothetical protein
MSSSGAPEPSAPSERRRQSCNRDAEAQQFCEQLGREKQRLTVETCEQPTFLYIGFQLNIRFLGPAGRSSSSDLTDLSHRLSASTFLQAPAKEAQLRKSREILLKPVVLRLSLKLPRGGISIAMDVPIRRRSDKT